jgi:uncharacterized protein YbjT (DUF2867 family)
MKVLVAGAYGFAGRRLCPALADAATTSSPHPQP